MKKYILNEKDIEYLKKALQVQKHYKEIISEESILEYNKVCDHDDGHFCEHRLEWLINYIESKEIR